MPFYVNTDAVLPPGSYTSMPAGADLDRIRAIAGAKSSLYQWFDVALTAGAHVAATGAGPTSMMDMWDERSPRLDLVSTGTSPPALTLGGNNATALRIDNDAGSEYVVMGASDNTSLQMPSGSEWSVVAICRPQETAANVLLGYETGASTGSSDYAPYIRYIPQGSYSQCPVLMNSAGTSSRIYDYGMEYANRDHILAIGFDTANGLTLSQNGFVRANNNNTVNGQHLLPLTDLKFQLFGLTSGVSSVNFNGLFYGLLMYRVNIFKTAYADMHRAVVKAYGDKLGLAHAFA